METGLFTSWAKIAGIGGITVAALVLIIGAILRQRLLSKLGPGPTLVLLLAIVGSSLLVALSGIRAWSLKETGAAPALLPQQQQTVTEKPRPPAEPRSDKPQLYRVRNVQAGHALQMRATPGVSGAIVGRIPAQGQDVEWAGEKIRTKDGAVWYRVRYAGTSGWVNARFLQTQS